VVDQLAGIAFRGEGLERRAWVVGSAFDVWQIVDAYRDIGSIEMMVEGSSVNEHQIRLAFDYFAHYPDEIDAAILENRRPIAELEAEFPLIEVSRI
jgi:hypothetical protein